MNKKIKISLVDEDEKEIDFITRRIPDYKNYDFSKGVLIDLLLLFGRNNVDISLVNNSKEFTN